VSCGDRASAHPRRRLVADADITYELTGNGDVLEPTDGIGGIGSGGAYALAAARALKDIDGLDAAAVARKAMDVAADMCVYTNHNFIIEELPHAAETTKPPAEVEKNEEPDANTATA